MKKAKPLWLLAITVCFILLLTACTENTDEQTNDENENAANDDTEVIDGMAYNPPDVDELDPDDPMTELIQYGKKVFNETNTVASEHVGNELSCQSCHADGGISQSSSMVGVVTQFPQYRGREGGVFTMQDRINGCMVRSMNGKKFDSESKEMKGMVAYLTKISEGIEVGEDIPWRMQNTMKEIPEPSVERGEELYTKKNCMTCHADDGSGTGANSGPALWGEDSFNDGAGMSRMSKMAGYIKNNMPVGQAGDLTDQEAADLAAFLLSHERPEWSGHDSDWPKGGRPTDIMNKERRKQVREGTFDWTEIENVVPADNSGE
ncbi:Thiosulfate dehydrogenase [Lentibacillus sp. JNUCC-1]|uniref:c-type cytochrome n=1 Tax=Lentibacillus sp. JNUCC-1 TaxID=2654513 RepID=UPI0012E7AD02|nr:c-type cytochrome [Lentibacillus sp. JNUCC-1]MUV38912.1 Thiosulfate dehydrogenase [Lentibacillus sp. JNUCC-1]